MNRKEQKQSQSDAPLSTTQKIKQEWREKNFDKKYLSRAPLLLQIFK